MSSKASCPGCNAYTSDVLFAIREGQPCPHCGLSAEAILEINEVRNRQADEVLKQRLEKSLLEAGRAKAEADRLRSILEKVRDSIGCTRPYTPHEHDDPLGYPVSLEEPEP
jgi:hypothetical protein